MFTPKEYESPEQLFLEVEILGMKKNYNPDQKVFCLLERLRTECMRTTVYEKYLEKTKDVKDGKDKYEIAKALVSEKFSEFYPDKINFLSFMDRKIKPGENLHDFARSIRQALKKSSPGITGEALDNLIKERILYSLPQNVSNIIRMDEKIALEALIKKAQILIESPRNDICAVNKGSDVTELINLLKEVLNTKRERDEKTSGKRFSRNQTIKCWTCGKNGHLSRSCRNNKDYRNSKGTAAINGHTTTVSIDGDCEEGLIDTGSSNSLIDSRLVKNFKPTYSPSLYCANGSKIDVIGRKKVSVKIDGKDLTWNFMVVKNLFFKIIIGRDFLYNFNVSINMTNNVMLINDKIENQKINVNNDLDGFNKYRLLNLIDKYKCIISFSKFDIGCTNLGSHKIETSDSKPVIGKCYRIPISLKTDAMNEISLMLKNGIIKESNSAWRAPVTLVPKKDGSRRFCVDYRSLNSQIKMDRYPLPNMIEIIESLNGNNFFSTIDLKNAYWQVPMDPNDMEKTAFSPGPGLGIYEFLRMPFGLANAPSTCQRILDRILSKFTFARSYIDDIIVFSKSFDDHLEHLKKIFDALLDAKLKISIEKCKFGFNKIKYLGYEITNCGIRIDPYKIQGIFQWKDPESKDELHRFLGTCAFYQNFIDKYADITAEMYDMLKKENKFVWSESIKSKFIYLKEKMSSLPTLTMPSEEGNLILRSDASNRALGCVLSQEKSGKEFPISFASRKLNKAEMNYATVDREILALVWGIKKFRHYLIGKRFIVETDHNPIKYLQTFKDSHNRRSRWLMSLMEYSFEIRYIPGSRNVVADGLSRSLANVEEIDLNYKVLLEKLRGNVKYKNTNNFGEYTKYMAKIVEMNNNLFLKTDKKLLQIIPKNERDILILTSHIRDACHSSIEKTKELIIRNFFWPKMSKDIKRKVDSCESCAKFKTVRSKNRAKLKLFSPNESLESWNVDFIGPLPETEQGNKYILLFIDPFTKWIEAFPSSIQSSNFVLDCLKKVIARFGVPKNIHSDQGRQFESVLVNDFCTENNIVKSRTTPYHPEGNGMAERAVQSLKQKLKQMCEEDGENTWDQHLDNVLMSLRNVTHKSIQKSPSMALYGKNMRTVSESLYAKGAYQKSEALPRTENDSETRKNLKSSQIQYKAQHDKGIVEKVYKHNDLVMVKKPFYSALESPYYGPFKIIGVRHPVYKIVQCDDNSNTLRVHFNRLKIFNHENSRRDPYDDDSSSDEENDKPIENSVNEERVKRKIKIPEENQEYCKKYLPSIFMRGGMSGD